jgi:phage minor structural protein
MAKTPIYVFDKLDNLLTICSDYTEAPFTEDINQDEVTFNLILPSDHEDSEHIVGGNQIAFQDLEGRFRLFTIREIDDENGRNDEKRAICLSAMDELHGKIVEDKRPTDVEATVAIDNALEGTRFQRGNVAQLGLNSSNFYYISSRESLSKIRDTWGGELVDRIEIDPNTGKISGRFIDLLERRGMDRGKRFEIDKDIDNITRTELYYPKTALYGRGSSIPTGDGFSRKLTFEDVEWKVSSGDPVDKPLGVKWVGDPDALEDHGIPQSDGSKEHVYGVFEDNDEKDQASLLIKTWNALKSEKIPKVRYKMSVITFHGIVEYEHEVAYLGDTGIAINKKAKPEILVESRIIKLSYDIGDPTNGDVTIGNFLDLNDDQERIDWVVDKVTNDSGNWNNSDAVTEVTDDSFPDITPPSPTGVKATGLFKSIVIEWDYNPSSYIASYEVYASQVNNFVPDSSNLIFRGKSGGTVLQAENDQQWYFRVRSANTHGTVSSLSTQVTAQTIRISEVDFDELMVVDAFIENVLADKITSGTLNGALANIINLNADNIVTGVLKAEFVKIGSGTDFDPGYDPSKKAEYAIGPDEPTDLNVIWIDTTDSSNVIWKVYNNEVGGWIEGPSGPRGPQGLQGIQGPEGDQGIQGPSGEDGMSSFTHIAYADSPDGTVGFSVSDSTDKEYIGMYVDSDPNDSTTPSDYKWTLIKGSDGEDGIPGPKGDDGQTPYLHIAYANSSDGASGFSTTDATNKKYIGTYTDFTIADSTIPSNYTWALIKGDKGDTGDTGPQGPQGVQGVQGPKGSDGTSQYVHIRYSPNSNGSSMTTSPQSTTAYIGLANTTSSTAPTSYTSYTWSLFKGPQGDQGIQGPTGADGQPTYTWVKYADDGLGGNMSDTPDGKRFIGLAFNKTTQTESTSSSAYQWSPLYDNVEVGGRNYIPKSSFGSLDYLIDNEYRWNFNSTAQSVFSIAYTTLLTYFDAGTYTLSFNAKINSSEGVNYSALRLSSSDDGSSFSTVSYVGRNSIDTTMKRITYTFTIDTPKYIGLQFYNHEFGLAAEFNADVDISNIQLELGNIATAYQAAPEDINDEIKDKASNTDLDNLAGIVSDVSAEVNLKAGMGEFQALEEAFNTRVEQDIADKEQLAADLATIEGRTAIVETIAGNNKIVSEFINTVITESEEGIYISNGVSSTGILIGSERISFIDNDTEVAYISNQTMQINHGIFVQSATISDFKFEKIPGTTILAITWVGD